jgi:hypothetical protein
MDGTDYTQGRLLSLLCLKMHIDHDRADDITDRVCIGQEVPEEPEYKPASYFIRRDARYKYTPSKAGCDRE